MLDLLRIIFLEFDMPQAIMADSFNISMNENPESPGMCALCFEFLSNGHKSPHYAIPVKNSTAETLRALRSNVEAIIRALSDEVSH